MRTVGYIRVSGSRQVREGFGLETQERRIRAYATSQGWRLAEVIRDEAMSGAATDRPGFLTLKRMVLAGEASRVVIYKLDRLSRSLVDLKEFVDRVLLPTNSALVSVTEQIDTGSSGGKLFINILGSFAEFERDLITERLKTARESKVMAGSKGAGQVFGYRWRGEGRKRALYPLRHEAETVRRIFEAYAKKPCLNSLTAYAAKTGLKTREGKPFARSTLRYILENPFYAGTIRHGTLEQPGRHEPIVPPALYARVQKHLAKIPRRKRC